MSVITGNLCVSAADYFSPSWSGNQDVAPAIQAAINAVSAAGGGTVEIPKGTWTVGTCLKLASNVQLCGVDNGATLVTKGSASGAADIFSGYQVNNVSIQNLIIDGSDNNDATPLVKVTSCNDVIFNNVTVENTNGIGVVIQGNSSHCGVENSIFSNIGNLWSLTGSADDRYQGLIFCSGDTNVDNFATNDTFSNIGLDALQVSNQINFVASKNTFNLQNEELSTIISTNYPAGIYATIDSNADFLGNTINNSAGCGIDTVGLVNSVIDDNIIAGSGASGIGLFSRTGMAQASGIVVSGNIISDTNNWNDCLFKGAIEIYSGAAANITLINNQLTANQLSGTPSYSIQILDASPSNLSISTGNKLLGEVSVEGLGANLLASLPTLEANVVYINSIITLDGPVTVSAAQFQQYQAALDKINTGFAISDTISNIASALDAMESDAELNAITFTDVGQLSISVTQSIGKIIQILMPKITNPLIEVETSAGTSIYAHGVADTPLSASNSSITLTVNSRMDVAGSFNTIVSGANSNIWVSGSCNTMYLSSGATASVYGTVENWDWVSGSSDTFCLMGSQASITGGDDTVYLSGGATASLYSTAGSWDRVSGSNGTVCLVGSQASIVGADDVVYLSNGATVSLYGTAGNWDWVSGSNDIVCLVGSQASIIGGDDTVYLSGGATASLYSTAGNWDQVSGSNDIVCLVGSQASITGGGDTVYLSGGATASLYGTAGNWDWVSGSNGTVCLGGSQASITGGGDVVYLSGGATASLYGTAGNWDQVSGSNDTVCLVGSQASITGGGDAVYLSGRAMASLYGTAGNWDWVSGSNDTVCLVGSQASITGGGDAVYLSGRAMASLYGTAGNWDWVSGSNDTVCLVGSQASITGGGDVVYLSGGATASLYGTAGNWDQVSGSNGIIGIRNAQTTVAGNNDVFMLGQNYGIDQITGFNSSDTLQLSAVDWSSWNAFTHSGAMTNVSGGVQIKLDANDILTLSGLSTSHMLTSEFRFA